MYESCAFMLVTHIMGIKAGYDICSEDITNTEWFESDQKNWMIAGRGCGGRPDSLEDNSLGEEC